MIWPRIPGADLSLKEPLNPSVSSIIGDINDDGIIGTTGLLMLQHSVVGQISLNSQQLYRADLHPVGGDDIIDIIDLLALEALVLTQ